LLYTRKLSVELAATSPVMLKLL